MRLDRGLLALFLTVTPLPMLAQTPPAEIEEEAEDRLGNPEMKAMLKSDQAARQGTRGDPVAVAKADAERRVRVRELLESGAIRTKHDYYAAAFIFQHGSEPEDYLLAHVFAVRSLGLGMKEAEWIAAATLDRYLQSIARDQIYGTQYQRRMGEEATQGRYNPMLLTDQLRTGAGVETLEGQKRRLAQMNAAPADPN